MSEGDIYKDIEKQKQLLDRISPKFNEMTADVQEIMQNSDDPKLIAALLFKLAEEREKANRLMESINEKYDKIMFELKTKEMSKEVVIDQKARFEVLPEQDQIILEFLEKQGGAGAREIQTIMHYKRSNAACQRLNKLYKEGFLKKVQSGKQVLYLAKS